jgi:hypothetical protein
VAPNEIDLTSRTRSMRVLRPIGYVLALLVAAGCLASFVAGPEETAVRLIAGGAGLLIVLAFVWAVTVHRRLPSRLMVDHEGIRVLDGHGRKLVRLAWIELAGVGVMTNELARARKKFAGALDGVPPVPGALSVPIWLELFPANAEAVARHPELDRWWKLGKATPPGEAQRWLVLLGDGRGQEFPIEEAVKRWRPDLWRGHRSGSLLLGAHDAWLAQFTRDGRRPERDGGNA